MTQLAISLIKNRLQNTYGSRMGFVVGGTSYTSPTSPSDEKSGTRVTLPSEETNKQKFPRLQLLTVKELMEAKGIERPTSAAAIEETFKKAPEDAVKLAMGLVATMTALLLGMLVSSAKHTYDTRRSEVIAHLSNSGTRPAGGRLDRNLRPTDAERIETSRALMTSTTNLSCSIPAAVVYSATAHAGIG